MVNPRVFVDSSVIISSLLSVRGGSFYILNNWKVNFQFQTNVYGLNEIQRTITEKFPHHHYLASDLFTLLGSTNMQVLKNPSKSELKQSIRHISASDAPILASALFNSDYLITLDNEFFGTEVTRLAQKNSLIILKPKDFIAKLRPAA